MSAPSILHNHIRAVTSACARRLGQLPAPYSRLLRQLPVGAGCADLRALRLDQPDRARRLAGCRRCLTAWRLSSGCCRCACPDGTLSPRPRFPLSSPLSACMARPPRLRGDLASAFAAVAMLPAAQAPVPAANPCPEPSPSMSISIGVSALLYIAAGAAALSPQRRAARRDAGMAGLAGAAAVRAARFSLSMPSSPRCLPAATLSGAGT